MNYPDIIVDWEKIQFNPIPKVRQALCDNNVHSRDQQKFVDEAMECETEGELIDLISTWVTIIL
jgi:hypothetical protein